MMTKKILYFIIILTFVGLPAHLLLSYAKGGEKTYIINGVPYGKYTVYTVGKGKKLGKYKNEVVVSTISDPKTFNPHTANESSSTESFSYVFEGLTDTDGVTLEVVPELAESWEVSKDGLVWIFHLRKDVKFHDGVQMTADDVVFSFNDIVLNDDIPGIAMRDILTIEGEKPIVEKIDDFTVRMTLPSKFAPFARIVGGVEIVPKHLLKKAVDAGNYASTWNVDTDPKEIIGTGPYRLVDYKNGQMIVQEANPLYWKRAPDGSRMPKIKKRIMLIVPDINTSALKFKGGETDFYGLRMEDYALFKKDAIKKDYSLYDCGEQSGTLFFFLNQNVIGVPEDKQIWFRDLEFRQACAYAIDREAIIRNVYLGLAIPLYSPEPASNKIFHNPNVKKYEYNLERAKKILKDAGYKDYDGDGIIEKPKGNPVKFIVTTNAGNNVREKSCQIITADLKKLGMDVTFAPLEFNNLVAKLQSTCDWEAMVMGLTGGIEPHFGANVWNTDGRTHMWNQKPSKPSEQSEFAEWERKVRKWEKGLRDWEYKFEEIFARGVKEMDQEKRVKTYWEWQELAAEKLPVIYLVTSNYIPAMRNKFKNQKPTAYGLVFHNMDTELEITP